MTTPVQSSLFWHEPRETIYRANMPIVNPAGEAYGAPSFEWDIPYTIKELSYSVHNHYRYYGKFPPVVAGQIIDDNPPPSSSHYILDNFCGSGTSLVEAKLRGILSYGVDISWLSALVSNVKTAHIDLKYVLRELSSIVLWHESYKKNFSTPDDSICRKWFAPEASRDLLALQTRLTQVDDSKVRAFLVVAFLAIVRRVSMAFDGEVRPHINKKKQQRNVIGAFAKKVRDMCARHSVFMQTTSDSIAAECIVADNKVLPERFYDGKCYLAISHPPYLNSFNYTPVYRLEFYWGERFEAEYSTGKIQLYEEELRAHPADEDVVRKYFNHLSACYGELYEAQRSGATLAIVIGDCTRNKELVPVVGRTVKIVEDLGYRLTQVNYRTTHYGLGKYAYKARADYHGTEAEKRDAIIVFRR